MDPLERQVSLFFKGNFTPKKQQQLVALKTRAPTAFHWMVDFLGENPDLQRPQRPLRPWSPWHPRRLHASAYAAWKVVPLAAFWPCCLEPQQPMQLGAEKRGCFPECFLNVFSMCFFLFALCSFFFNNILF